MKTKSKTRYTKPPKDQSLCQHHQGLGAFAASLNRLPDAAQVKKQKRQSVPRGMLPMIF